MDSKLTSYQNSSQGTNRVNSQKSKASYYNGPHGYYIIPQCLAKGLPVCPPEDISLPEKPKKYLELPLVKKAKLFECKQSVDSEMSPNVKEASEESPSTVEDEMQLEDIQTEVDRIKLRVSQLDQLLGLNTPECPQQDSCVDLEIELKKYDINPEILELQRNNHKLQQQNTQLQLIRKVSDLSLKRLRKDLCRDQEQSVQLQKRLNELDSFKRTLEREQALCAQRYRHLERDKYSFTQCHSYFDQNLHDVNRLFKKFITITEHRKQKRKAVTILDSLKLHCKSLHDSMLESYGKLDSHMNGKRAGPSMLTTLLYRNENLFNTRHKP